jgi:hypothetical protein
MLGIAEPQARSLTEGLDPRKRTFGNSGASEFGPDLPGSGVATRLPGLRGGLNVGSVKSCIHAEQHGVEWVSCASNHVLRVTK